jgi:hypothetical protein
MKSHHRSSSEPTAMPDELHLVLEIHLATCLGWGGPGRPTPEDNRLLDCEGRRRGVSRLWRPASVRSFSDVVVPVPAVCGVLDRAYGIHRGRRNVPSTGALYGLRITAVPMSGGAPIRVSNMGTMVPVPGAHVDGLVLRESLFHQLEGNPWVVILQGDVALYTNRYGARGYRYLMLEAGHFGQEAVRAATDARLVCCPLGGFDDHRLNRLFGGALTCSPVVYALAIGYER